MPGVLGDRRGTAEPTRVEPGDPRCSEDADRRESGQDDDRDVHDCAGYLPRALAALLLEQNEAPDQAGKEQHQQNGGQP